MRRSDLMHMDTRALLCQPTSRPGVIEVDVS